MLFPRPRRVHLPFPFNNPTAQYFYLARNGIYALARLWTLTGQEILFPAYFHGVELEALLAADVRLRFYPVRERMRVDVDDVVARITPETRAIYLIHYLGFPAPVEELAVICRNRDLLLVEDCALALLSRLGEKPLGTFGDAAVFCLYKTLPVPNGGVLVLRSDDPARMARGTPPSLASTLALAASSLDRHFQLRGNRRLRLLLKGMRAFGKSLSRASGAERVEIGSQHFDSTHAELAMSRLVHLVVGAQDFSSIFERRRRNFLHLLDRLRDVAPPVFEGLPMGVCPLSYPIQVPNKQSVVEQLVKRGVEAVNFWFPDHPAGPKEVFTDVAKLRHTVLELPCHQDLTPQEIDRVADHVCDVLREVD